MFIKKANAKQGRSLALGHLRFVFSSVTAADELRARRWVPDPANCRRKCTHLESELLQINSKPFATVLSARGLLADIKPIINQFSFPSESFW